MSTYCVQLNDIRAAHTRIEAGVHRTPVFTSSTADARLAMSVFFKCENVQRAGSFKIRGALNAVMSRSDREAGRGVVTHSSGNFAQALSLAAKIRQIPAHIVMPDNAPQVKRDGVAGYGGRIILCESTNAARAATAERVCLETGGSLVHPSNQPEVIAGQGTIALELMEQCPDLDVVIAPVGGGGLISGIALALRELAPKITVLAAEPLGADDAYRSKVSGTLLEQTAPDTVADGLRTSLGSNTWPVVRDCVDEIIRVDDASILREMRWIWERMKLVVEPSSATTLAALTSLSEQGRFRGARVAAILSGGNVDLNKIPFLAP